MVITEWDQKDHLQKLVNIENSFFGQDEIEYLGFQVTHDIVITIDKNIQVKNEATNLPNNSATVYRCSELLLKYTGKMITYVLPFN